MSDEENFDPFEEESTTHEEEDTTVEPEEEEVETNEDEETTDESTDETEEETTDEEESSDDETEVEDKDETSEEKQIPESRFKAAIKDVQDKLDEALQENAQLKAVEAPDRNEDPEGYEAHLRLEMSKQLMSEFKDDYQEKMLHFREMAKNSPHLNNVVAIHELPAKLAYDLATRDLEIREMTEARQSDEWKEFQEFKKNKGKAKKEETTIADELGKPTSKAKLPKNI